MSAYWCGQQDSNLQHTDPLQVLNFVAVSVEAKWGGSSYRAVVQVGGLGPPRIFQRQIFGPDKKIWTFISQKSALLMLYQGVCCVYQFHHTCIFSLATTDRPAFHISALGSIGERFTGIFLQTCTQLSRSFSLLNLIFAVSPSCHR